MSLVFDPNQKISQYFTFKDALWLPSWNRMASESDGLNDQVVIRLKNLFKLMDEVRMSFNLPIMVHCAYRPKEYNSFVKGAKHSAHLAAIGNEAAVDFHVKGKTCQQAIKHILDHDLLTRLNLRCENNGENPSWIHIDTKPTSGLRYFLP